MSIEIKILFKHQKYTIPFLQLYIVTMHLRISFKGTVLPCNKLISEKRAWKIIISMKITIAFDYIYQEIK